MSISGASRTPTLLTNDFSSTCFRRLDWLHPNSFLQIFALMLGCPCLSIEHLGLFQQHQTTIMSTPPALQTAECATVATGCPDHGFLPHMTAPARSITCFHLCTSKICFRHNCWCSLSSICSSTLLRLNTSWPWWTTPLEPPNYSLHRKILRERPCLACCCLNFDLSVNEMPKACPLHTPAKTKPILNSFLAEILTLF